MDTNYLYPHNPRIRSLITKIIYDRGTETDLEEISRNFVLEDDIVLESKDKHTFDDSIAFLSSKNTFVARRTGFVYFNNNEIKIFPIVGVSEEKLFSYLIVPSNKFTKNILTPAKLRDEIQRYEFKNQIPSDFLRHAIQLFSKAGGYKVINQGTPMIPNRVDDILFDTRFNFNPTNFYYIGNKRQISSEEISFYAKVEEGDHIGEFKHFIGGEIGEDVYGFPIEKETINSYYQLGEGLDKLEMGDIRAKESGFLRVHLDGEVTVRPTQVIKDDIKKNITFDTNEDVIIEGNVYPSIKINVKNNLIILGSVEGIAINCGGDLLIAGGINNKCEVNVENNCHAQFVANSKLNCEKNIFIAQYILNSEVKAKEDIIVRNKQLGEIVGGEIDTQNGSIETNTVGSISGIATNLKVGVEEKISKNKSLKNIIDELKKEKILLESNMKRIKPRIIFTYTRIKKDAEAVSYQEKANFKKSLQVYKKLIDDLKAKNQEIDEALEQTQLENSAKRGKHQIRIFNEVYGGVNVQIKNIKYFFKYNSYRPYLLCKHPVLPKIESLVLKEKP